MILFSISMILSYVHVIILNKDIPNVDDFYLKLKSKYGTLLGYRFHQKLHDFYPSLCRQN